MRGRERAAGSRRRGVRLAVHRGRHRRAVAFCQRNGGRQIAGIVITSPDNPTGHTLALERQIALGQAALEQGVPFVLYDWIYHYITEGEPASANAVLGASRRTSASGSSSSTG